MSSFEFDGGKRMDLTQHPKQWVRTLHLYRHFRGTTEHSQFESGANSLLENSMCQCPSELDLISAISPGREGTEHSLS